MRKAFIIIISLAIVLLIAIWAYLLFFGPGPASVEQNNTEFGTSPETDFISGDNSDDTRSLVSIEDELTQLTTNPIAGSIIFERDGALFVRYVEQGTGYIYEIALATGEETRVTGVTVPRVVDAVFAPSGTRVALTIETGPYDDTIFIADITKNDQGNFVLSGFDLEDGAHSPAFNEVGDGIRYAVAGERNTVGISLDLKSNEQTHIFSVPFTQIEVLWGDEIYFYSKPSARTRGYVYQINGNSLKRIGNEGFGLMSLAANEYVTITANEADNTPVTTTYDLKTGSTTILGLWGYVEKCTASRSVRSYLWCADTFVIPNGTLPDLWYQGVVTLEDTLVLVNLQSGGSTLELDLTEAAGRPLDAVDLMIDKTDSYLIFTNKTDATLWLYNATVGRPVRNNTDVEDAEVSSGV